jgi:hypothetical protein
MSNSPNASSTAILQLACRLADTTSRNFDPDRVPISLEPADAPPAGEPKKTVKLPAALCGRLAEKGDSDGYCFTAHKNSIYTFEVMARRAGSECDPVLRLLDAKGTVLTEVDDTPGMGKDARIEWKAPSDAIYAVQIADLHARGGEALPDVVLAEQASPDFSVTCDPDMINVGQAVNLAVVLQHLGRIHGNPLPPGVKVRDAGSKTLLGPKETRGKIIIEAAANASACEKVPIAVMGHVSINFVVKSAYCSKPILVTVKP